MNSGTPAPSVMEIVVSAKGPLQEQEWTDIIIDIKSMIFREFDRITLRTFGQTIWLRGNPDERSTNHKVAEDFRNRDEDTNLISLLHAQGIFFQCPEQRREDGSITYDFWGLTRKGPWVMGTIVSETDDRYHTAQNIVEVRYLDDVQVGHIIWRMRKNHPDFSHLKLCVEISALWGRMLSERDEVTKRLEHVGNYLSNCSKLLRVKTETVA